MQYLFLYGSKCGLLENPTPCSKIDFSKGPRLSGSSSSTSGTVFHPVCLPPFSPSRSGRHAASHPIRAYEDNTSTRQLANDPGKLRNRSKHFELRFMVVQELVQRALISMVYVPTKYQLADLLTKSTTAATFSRIMPMLTGYARFDHSRYTS